MGLNAARKIEDYFWHVKEYDEWAQRVHIGDANDALKQEEMLRHHELMATSAWRDLHLLWGRIVFVDGVPYEIHPDKAEHEWDKLIEVKEREEVA